MNELPNSIEVDRHLDLTGLDCPIPVLRAKVALREMNDEEVIHVTATDPHAKVDFEAFCARTGHDLISQKTVDGVLHFYIRRRAGAWI